MNRLHATLSLTLAMLTVFASDAFTQVSEEPLPDVEEVPARFRVFASRDASEAEKLQQATQVAAVTDQELNVLHEWIKQDAGTGRLYALTTLVTVRDQRSVPHIGQALLSNENRYYALALGIIGDDQAIDYLRSTLAQTQRPHVERACKLALRMLGAQADETAPPPQTLTGDIVIDLSASTNTLLVGDSFTLATTVRNTTDRPLRIAWSDFFNASYLRVYSSSGEYVLPAQLIYDFQPGTNSFQMIEPEGQFTIEGQCRVIVTAPDRTEWKEVLPAQEVFYLEGPAWGYELGLYSDGKNIDVKLAIVYEPDFASHWLTQFGIQEGEVVRTRTVSNLAELHISSAN